MSRAEDIVNGVFGMVEEYGHAVMYVFPTEGEDGPSFSYTVGLTEKGWPEIVAQALPAQIAQAILNDLVWKCLDRGRPPEIGEVFEDLANFPVMLGGVSDSYCRENLGMALRRASQKGSDSVRALQLILSDRAGRLPFEEDYDREHMDKFQKPLNFSSSWELPRKVDTVN